MAIKTWQLDTTHTTVGFMVRHMVVAKVHGRFTRFEGKVEVNGDDLAQGSAEVKIDVSSIDTGVEQRDNHLRSPDFFDAAAFPKLIFRSKRVQDAGKGHYRVVGDLTIRDVTREVVLETELLGKVKDPWGNERLAFQASTSIDRKDFGLSWNQALEAGGLLVGERVDITLDVQAVAVAAEKAA
ncbi:YceI family protein [Myxococcus sp. CA051A]|uniref:YceI family protein n=1 Tax=Myxococcus llanfairpwllgwyngyllgogerychwyrndrobwllllantysiliogogogochensis TaxID=2590453 RepID=A0A540X2X7_9BACT|nr:MULTISPECIES: YceI family protein [Myxococcus]NTX04985.1 YceI family protein [Myxococcus sp. CA040A]NTX15338.1 YceI family protein [Myxococcus sp. CA056]NTX37908.1 YceI family protein [Myxococcus sp. CA033]NTX54065.1 YceI family protein [Myxococcus sp. CA039A]NTX61557.1 YceI family protein [Myxococcus sp. CA051A]